MQKWNQAKHCWQSGSYSNRIRARLEGEELPIASNEVPRGKNSH